MRNETKYCYHCRSYHAVYEMRQIVSKSGKRWRCIRSIEASRNDLDARAEFGRQTTRLNSEVAKSYTSRSINAENIRRVF